MDLELSPEEEKLLAADDRASERFGYWMIAVCGLLLAALAVPVLQGVQWLRTGIWSPLAFKDALQVVEIEPAPVAWVGLQRIADWIWELPFAVVLFLAAMTVLFWLTRDGQGTESLRTARMKRARKASSRTS